MIDFLRQYAKAIVALLAPLLVAIGARAGLSLSDEQAITLATLVTGFLVYLVPNKPKDLDPQMVRQAYEELQRQLKAIEEEGANGPSSH